MNATRDPVSPEVLTTRPLGAEEAVACLDGLSGFEHVLLAVSGGSDSMALLHLIADAIARARWVAGQVVVATVDHGLRPDSAAEADFVARESDARGLAHVALAWTGDKPATGLQKAAREARYRLLCDWAARQWPEGRTAVVTAHTMDDQAETVLMRLARGTGVDGLSGMAAKRRLRSDRDIWLVRPLLGVAKARLAATLTASGRTWREDPSNEQLRFERVRWRQACALLQPLGLDAPTLATVARRQQEARAALDEMADAAEVRAGLAYHGGAFAEMSLPVLLSEPVAIRHRVIQRLLTAFGGQADLPRLSRVEAFAARFETFAGGSRAGTELDPPPEARIMRETIGGCLVDLDDGRLRVMREFGRVPIARMVLAPGETREWDRRFRCRLTRDATEVADIAAYGDLAHDEVSVTTRPDVSALPKEARLALPVATFATGTPRILWCATGSPLAESGPLSVEWIGATRRSGGV